MQDLKPCHVCKGKPHITATSTIGSFFVMVSCMDEHHTVQVRAEAKTLEEAEALAIEKWNRRVMSELVPCPFCGGETRFSDWNFIQGFRFNCTLCRAVFILDAPKNTFLKKNEKELEKVAIEIWNRRHYPAEVQQAMERMKPKKPERRLDGWNCPRCEMFQTHEWEVDQPPFCWNCGQALDWEV